MMTRTRSATVTFRHPFRLPGLPDEQPAGEYLTETDEELITGVSVIAYRRVKVLVHLRRTSRPGRSETVWIDPGELDDVLSSDAAVDAG